METRKGITLLDILAIIIVFLIAMALFSPSVNRLMRHKSRVVCGTNLKGLGTAHTVYANDYDDEYPKLGRGRWAKQLGYSFEDRQFRPYDFEGDCTITSSLYMLVREADVSPKSFICPQSDETPFDGKNNNNLDLVELWDFGPNPYPHVSYVYHNPYGKFPPDGTRLASFAIMADMSPWITDGNFLPANNNPILPPQIIDHQKPDTFDKGNSLDHNKYEKKGAFWFLDRTLKKDTGFGQNITYADGHASFEIQPNVGQRNDNIYTFWSTEENPTEQDRQGGTAPTSRSPENDAKSEEDSFLAI